MWQQCYLEGIFSLSWSLQAVCALAGILIVTGWLPHHPQASLAQVKQGKAYATVHRIFGVP